MVQFGGGQEPPIDYPEKLDYYMGYFTNIILSKAPKNIEFDLYEIIGTLGLNDNEAYWYKFIAHKIHLNLVNNGYAYEVGRYLRLSANKERSGNITNTVNYHNSNIIQDSNFVNSPTNINATPAPNKNDPKSILERVWKLMDHKIVVYILTLIIGFILAYFGITHM